MPTAIILLNTAIGMEKDVLKWLKNHEYVVEAFRVQSVYDIIGKVKAESYDKLREIISGIKRSLPKTYSVVTMFIVENAVAVK